MTTVPPLRALYVAYPLLPVTEESCGGAEQVLWTLEREMSRRGHSTALAACDGSSLAGELFATGAASERADVLEQRNAEHTARVIDLLRREGERFDLVHDHSGHFWLHAAEVQLPVLATLHLPRSFYPAGFDSIPPNLFFNCVSDSQARTFAGIPNMLGAVTNGIALDRFPFNAKKDDYLLWLGRICEEKGPNVAIDVAQRAGLPLVIAGQVYPFSYHRQFFERKVQPRIDGVQVAWVQQPRSIEKVQLLGRARALLVTSLVDETSCLAAIEAAACGTPVVTFRRGALPEVVSEGSTGFLVDTPQEMAAAVWRVEEIEPASCRSNASQRFSASRMAADYEQLYRTVISSAVVETRARREGAA
jgi:glycosyltransferase involved in cell wall biosynthesis